MLQDCVTETLACSMGTSRGRFLGGGDMHTRRGEGKQTSVFGSENSICKPGKDSS